MPLILSPHDFAKKFYFPARNQMEYDNHFCRLLINQLAYPLRTELIDRALPLAGLSNSYLMFFHCPASPTTPVLPEHPDSPYFHSNHPFC